MQINPSARSRSELASPPFDPDEGCSHPPLPPSPDKLAIQDEMRPATRWLRSTMVHELVKRMRRRARADHKTRGTVLRTRMKKRKAALAMSAAVMGLSTAATNVYQLPETSINLVDVDPMRDRVDARALGVSDAMKEALAEEEGVRLTVYRDVAGYPTVGVGHLVTPADGLRVGDTITYERALDLLDQDLAIAEAAVKRLVADLPLYQFEFDALVDLVYNVGEGNVAPHRSPRLNDAIGMRDYAGIADELRYHHAGGAEARGLVFRSERRQAIFMEASYDDPRPSPVTLAGQASL